MNISLKEQLVLSFDGIMVDASQENRVAVTAPKESVLAILSFLKNYGFNHLGVISCVDWIEGNAFEVVYILHAYMADDETYTDKEKTCVLLKTSIPREKAACLSVIPIFANAEPYERELHELYGIHFDGHPRLTPLFLEREYKIPPFRKDFDTREYVKNTFDVIPAVGGEAEEK